MTPQELKNSILQLAIRGKLVEQRPEEGTAEELCQQIHGTILQEDSVKPKSKNIISDVSEDDLPFSIPDSWKWVRLGRIGYTNIGLTYNPQDISEAGTIVLRSSNIRDGIMAYEDIVRVNMNIPENKMCNKGDILICARNGSKRLVGKAAIIDQDGMSFGAFMAIFRSICNEYIIHVINSAYFRNLLLGDTGTTTINQITQDMLKNALIPLPPLAEQKRIVAKIEELLPYIDRYEQAWSKLEDFNKRFPGDMQKSILQAAIRGKLVEQRPKEGTGDELYQQIQAEKLRLIKAGTIKKEKPLPEITEDEKPFDIPESWKWVRIGQIFHLQSGKNITSGDIYDEQSEDHAYLCYGGNGKRGYVKTYNRSGRYALIGRQGALCGNINFAHGDFYATEHAVVVDHFNLTDVMWSGYFLRALNLNQYATSTAQPGLAVNNITKILIPLPPLSEQKRIIAKLEELLPLCERLK